MTQYIELAALLAEIENIESSAICEFKSDKSRYNEGVLDVIHRIKSLINTLEVEEIDLEKETEKWWKEHLHLNPKNKLWMDAHQSVVLAKYFFELGLKKQNENKS